MQISVDKPFEAWEEVQRHGQDLADKLAQGFNGLIRSHITPHSFSWPETPKLFDVEFPSQSFGMRDFGLATDNSGMNGVSAILDIGNKLGQAGDDFGACLNGMVDQFFRCLPMPFQQEENNVASLRTSMVGQQRADIGMALQEGWESLAEQFRNFGFMQNDPSSEELADDDIAGFNFKSVGRFGRSKVQFVVHYARINVLG